MILMTAAGRPAEAASRLQTWVSLQPQDASAWQLLGQAAQAQGLLAQALPAQQVVFGARQQGIAGETQQAQQHDAGNQDQAGTKIGFHGCDLVSQMNGAVSGTQAQGCGLSMPDQRRHCR